MKNARTLNSALALMAVTLSSANTAVAETPVVGNAAAPAGDLTITPVAKVETPAVPKAPSKAEISRGIMKSFHEAGKTYEEIIAEMIRVNGYDRQLARGTYKANFTKAGVPAPVEGTKPTKKVKTETAPAADAGAPAASTDAAPVVAAASTEVVAEGGTPAGDEAPV